MDGALRPRHAYAKDSRGRTEPALRNLCESLRAKLRGATTFTHNDKTAVIEALEVILGIPEQSLVWLYLNKGTHEEANRDDLIREWWNQWC